MSILHALRYSEAERFSDLMRPTGHTSDTFKFHLRKLVKLGYVIKTEDASYRLTPRGKEYANNLNERLRSTEKQPKLSVSAIVTTKNASGQTLYLMQQRWRNPFYGYWNEIHGRVEWGESFEETARRQLKRQTGLGAAFSTRGFHRVRNYDADGGGLLEDKLFVVMQAGDVAGVLQNDYSGGTNVWLTLEELYVLEKIFPSTLAIIEGLEDGNFYAAQDLDYSPGDY
jgi:DNA-binding HxlR family transcriptional regulator